MFHLQNNSSSPCNPDAPVMLMQQSRNAMSISDQLNQYNSWCALHPSLSLHPFAILTSPTTASRRLAIISRNTNPHKQRLNIKPRCVLPIAYKYSAKVQTLHIASNIFRVSPFRLAIHVVATPTALHHRRAAFQRLATVLV